MDPITVPGHLDALSSVGQYVMQAAAEAGLERAAAYRLRLSVDEIVTNIVLHGYQEAGLTGSITVRAEIGEDGLRLAVEDTGLTYDPRSTVLPTAADLAMPLEARDIGGLGIYLALKGVDQFDYQRVGDRNRSVFWVRRPTGAATTR